MSRAGDTSLRELGLLLMEAFPWWWWLVVAAVLELAVIAWRLGQIADALGRGG